jgi:bifunctional DNA-binding transcriptional regulator/antitoxin component of YhaV-PrlF toxin-antitoxin module
MGSITDERGRIYLPKDVRERYGEHYRIVELPTHVVLLPVDDDPLEGVREAVGDAFEGKGQEESKAEALAGAKAEIEAELEEREQRRKG